MPEMILGIKIPGLLINNCWINFFKLASKFFVCYFPDTTLNIFMYIISKMPSETSSLHHLFHLLLPVFPSANGVYCLTTYDFKECCLAFMHRIYYIIFISSCPYLLLPRETGMLLEDSSMFLFIYFPRAEPIPRHVVSVL